MNFLDMLRNNPRGWGNGPGPEPEIAYQDDGGNLFGFDNALVRKAPAPHQGFGDQSLTDMLIGIGSAPAKMAVGLAGGLSPYGSEGFQVPPLAADAWEAINAPGTILNEGMTPQDRGRTATNAAGFMMGGGLVAPRPANALAANGGRVVEGAKPIRAYRGASNPGNIARDDASILWGSSSPDVASTYARPYFNDGEIAGAVAPLDVNFRNPLTVDAQGGSWVGIEHNGQRFTADDLANMARGQGHDGLVIKNVLDAKSWYPGDPKIPPADNYVALQRGTVTSPLTGEVLFSNGSKSGAAVGASLPVGGRPIQFNGKNGNRYHLERQDSGLFSVLDDQGNHIAKYDVSQPIDTSMPASVVSADVDVSHQRNGISSYVYDVIENEMRKDGYSLAPDSYNGSGNQTPDGAAFWASRKGDGSLYSNGSKPGAAIGASQDPSTEDILAMLGIR